ncbi:phytoene/squalene synthase family protein [Rubrobacter taiwanensis]|jgi:phytoene synthase|uniref:Phytoene/squalene synthase family protein n=1 Tax=Rubrobacter taiwanensis TaxID=185139 RepID=A0A4R1BDV2_9ACTN|nr:phytoene/squalene synthase family protein [Rubrobacter taiwanensis]TCJ15305.1 phytoene/squalene synthase family protein [Rubrobacter taiwanensis]
MRLKECYEHCRRIHQRHGKTYYFSTLLFPPEVRPQVYALYAFMRVADEIVDGPEDHPPERQLRALQSFEEETLAAIRGEATENPVLRAFADTALRNEIPAGHIRSFMASMKMDTRISRYETYEDLEEYMYGSAAVVGLMMCRVMGVKSEAALPHAEALGVAMQLTNFLRDIREDWERGRVYLPLEDMKRFGYTEEDLAQERINEPFANLMDFEIERARRLYAFADRGLDHIPRGRRYPIAVARHLYAAILDHIERLNYDVFNHRAGTSIFEKLGVAAVCAARSPNEILTRRTGCIGRPGVV